MSARSAYRRRDPKPKSGNTCPGCGVQLDGSGDTCRVCELPENGEIATVQLATEFDQARANRERRRQKGRRRG